MYKNSTVFLRYKNIARGFLSFCVVVVVVAMCVSVVRGPASNALLCAVLARHKICLFPMFLFDSLRFCCCFVRMFSFSACCKFHFFYKNLVGFSGISVACKIVCVSLSALDCRHFPQPYAVAKVISVHISLILENDSGERERKTSRCRSHTLLSVLDLSTYHKYVFF